MIWKLEHLKTRKFKTLEIKKIYEFEFLFGSVAIFHIALPIARWLSKSVLVIDLALVLFETYNRIRVTRHWSTSHTRYLASVFFFFYISSSLLLSILFIHNCLSPSPCWDMSVIFFKLHSRISLHISTFFHEISRKNSTTGFVVLG